MPGDRWGPGPGQWVMEIDSTTTRRRKRANGALAVPPPVGVESVAIESTGEMCEAVRARLPESDALVMAAAPADFRPALVAETKIKKGDGAPALALAPTPDILLSTRDARRPGAVIVGFALETGDPVASAREKLERKGLDLVVANDATEAGAGFGVPTNRVTLVERGGLRPLPLLSKPDVAEEILDRVAELLEARHGR